MSFVRSMPSHCDWSLCVMCSVLNNSSHRLLQSRFLPNCRLQN
uniref:Uncharacterized protein n=1 Tax=Anguilla anguilla TaxID=7936 RepID=A0A0E9SEA9_ANGAN